MLPRGKSVSRHFHNDLNCELATGTRHWSGDSGPAAAAASTGSMPQVSARILSEKWRALELSKFCQARPGHPLKTRASDIFNLNV